MLRTRRGAIARRPATGGLTVNSIVYGAFGVPYRTDGYWQAPWGAHEDGSELGVGDWADGARPGGTWGGSTGLQADLIGNAITAANIWTQAVRDVSGSPITDVRVACRNLTWYVHVLSTNQWVLAELTDGIGGGAYTATTFAGTSDSIDLRSETQGVSYVVPSGDFAHGWSNVWPRIALPLNGGNANVDALFYCAEFRLIPGTDPNVDLASARYMVGVGGDFFQNTTQGSGPGIASNAPRMQYLTPSWKHYSQVSGWNEAQIRAKPPPLT